MKVRARVQKMSAVAAVSSSRALRLGEEALAVGGRMHVAATQVRTPADFA